MPRFFRTVPAALAALWLLAGCSALSALGEATTPLEAYELRAPAAGPVSRGRPLARDLVVEVPGASGALDTDRILIRPHPLQAQYLADARWSDPAPVMLQTLIVRSLENSQGLRYVGRRPLGAGGDFALVSELTDFQAEADTDGDGARVRLRLTARLVREADAAVVQSRTFQAEAEAATTEDLVLVEAFDRAAASLLTELTGWTLSGLGIRFDAPPS